MRTPKQLVNAQTGEVYYRVRYRKDGQQRALSFYGDTALADAEEFTGLLASLGADKAVAYWNAHLDDDSATRGMTLDDWWPKYLEATTGITEGTRDGYDGIYRRVWAPAIGRMPLTAITRPDIARVVNARAKVVADKTVANEYGILTGCLKDALLDGHIVALPTKGITLPRNTDHESEDMRFLTWDEWAAVYAQLPGHYRPLFTFLVGTGARYGEAEALNASDVDLAKRTVQLRKAAKWNATSAVRTVGPTKTKRSRRTVTLPPEVIVELIPLLDARGPGDRLFLGPRGGPIRHKTVWDVWVKARKAANLPDPQPRIHDLRHTHVSWLIAAGVPIVVIQRRLGHESIKTTMDRYGHLSPELEAAAADAASLAMRTPLAIG